MLEQIIRNSQPVLDACKAGDFDQALSLLLADTTEIKTPDLRTVRWLIINLPDQAVGSPDGTTEADVVLSTLQNSAHPRVKAAYDSMCADGIDLSDPQTQAMVPQIATDWPVGLVDKILQAGVRTVSAAEAQTGQVPTLDAVQAGYSRILVEDLELKVNTGLNESVNPAISSGNQAAVATALRLLADDLEA